MSTSLIPALGWVATGVFTASYFFTRPGALRRMQMLGAAMWLGYGVLLGAYPVMVANLLNLVVMTWTERRSAAKGAAPGVIPSQTIREPTDA